MHRSTCGRWIAISSPARPTSSTVHIWELYGKRAVLQSLHIPKIASAPDDLPERFETGTQNHEGIVGAGAAVDFLGSLGTGGSRRERLVRVLSGWHDRGNALFHRMWTGLSSVPGLRRYGAGYDIPRTATIAFVIEGLTSSEVVHLLAEQGLFCCHGDFYAPT